MFAPHVRVGVETRDKVEGGVHKRVRWDGKAAVNTFCPSFQRGRDLFDLIVLEPGFIF